MKKLFKILTIAALLISVGSSVKAVAKGTNRYLAGRSSVNKADRASSGSSTVKTLVKNLNTLITEISGLRDSVTSMVTEVRQMKSDINYVKKVTQESKALSDQMMDKMGIRDGLQQMISGSGA